MGINDTYGIIIWTQIISQKNQVSQKWEVMSYC